jgi:hypothetical protein
MSKFDNVHICNEIKHFIKKKVQKPFYDFDKYDVDSKMNMIMNSFETPGFLNFLKSVKIFLKDFDGTKEEMRLLNKALINTRRDVRIFVKKFSIYTAQQLHEVMGGYKTEKEPITNSAEIYKKVKHFVSSQVLKDQLFTTDKKFAIMECIMDALTYPDMINYREVVSKFIYTNFDITISEGKHLSNKMHHIRRRIFYRAKELDLADEIPKNHTDGFAIGKLLSDVIKDNKIDKKIYSDDEICSKEKTIIIEKIDDTPMDKANKEVEKIKAKWENIVTTSFSPETTIYIKTTDVCMGGKVTAHKKSKVKLHQCGFCGCNYEKQMITKTDDFYICWHCFFWTNFSEELRHKVDGANKYIGSGNSITGDMTIAKYIILCSDSHDSEKCGRDDSCFLCCHKKGMKFMDIKNKELLYGEEIAEPKIVAPEIMKPECLEMPKKIKEEPTEAIIHDDGKEMIIVI